MKKKLAALIAACALMLGTMGTVMLVNAAEDAGKNYFPSEGFENMLEADETEYVFSDIQRNSIGSLAVDSPAKAKKDADDNVYVELASNGTLPFASFFAMMRLDTAGDYNVSVDFYKEAEWTDTDNLGFRFYGAGFDSKGWAVAINEAEVGEWVTLSEVYTVTADKVASVDSFQMWFNTMNSNVLRVDNVSITLIPEEADAPSVENATAQWREASPADVVFTVDLKGQELVSVTNVKQDIELTQEEYSLNAEKTQLTFKSDYIADLGEGEWEFAIETAGGTVSVYISAIAKQGQIPENTDGYTLVDTLLAGDFEKYEPGLVFSATQTEEAWGSVSLDDPGVIADDNGNHVLKIAKKDGSNNMYASAFAMTSPEIQQGDIVTVEFDYKLDTQDVTIYAAGAPNFVFVGSSNQSYHQIDLDYSDHAMTKGVAENKWAVTYEDGENGWKSVKMSFIVDFAFLNATNSIRFLFPILNDTDALYIDNVRIIRWVNDEQAAAELPEVTPASATFDNNSAADVIFTVALKDYMLGSIKLDGKVVSSDNYTLTENDTKLTLKKDYLATLENGKHTFTITTLGGTVDFEITVSNHVAQTDEGGETGEKTGCSSSIANGVLIASAVVLGAAVTIAALRRKSENK